MVEGLVQRYDDSENWFVRWEEEERRCENDFLVPVPFGKIELMLPPWDAAGQISDFRGWPVQQQYSGRCSQWRGGPDDRRYWSAWEQCGWSRCVGHSSRKEVHTLTSLATKNRTLREARAKQHQVRMARGFFPQQQSPPDRNNGRLKRKCVFCGGLRWASLCPDKRGRTAEKKGDATAHVAYRKFAMSFHTEPSMFSQEALQTGWALMDCGANRCMGSWKELDGLARMNEQLYGSPRFSLDRTRKTWHTFANGERPQGEHEVAFQVNVGGKMGDCKIAYLNEKGVPILLSLYRASPRWRPLWTSAQMPHCSGIWQTRSLSCWKKRGKWTSLFLTSEGYALSINLWRGSVAWIPISCKSFGNSSQKKTGLSVCTRRRRDRWIARRKLRWEKRVPGRISAQQSYQRHWPKQTHWTSYNRSHASRLHVTNHWYTTATWFNAALHHRFRVLTSSKWWTCFLCHDRMSTISGRTNAFNWWNSWERHNRVGECWWWNWRPWSKTCFYRKKMDRNSLSCVSQKWTGVNLRTWPESWIFQ